MFTPLRLVFERTVKKGRVEVIDFAGRRYSFGERDVDAVVVRLKDRGLEKSLTFNPQLVLGEAYMDGRFIVEAGTIYDFLDIMLGNAERQPLPYWTSVLDGFRRLSKRAQQYNPARRARANAAHHYDIDGRFYDLFLDASRNYSCAYFHETNDLEEAQQAKMRHIAAKLGLKKGQKVLDIGCGWGAMGLYLAQTEQVDIAGITLSVEQLQAARARATQAGLHEHARFDLADYRQVEGRFDRIVSVGMFEHVGVNHYRTFFDKIRGLLDIDGVALIHAIGRFDTPTVTNPFIAKYIFPGGYIPALSEVLPAIERSGLILTDVEILRLHYAETLRHWRTRLLARWDEAVRQRGLRFCRMWEFYLAASETAFRYQGLMVFQLQLTRHQGALPLTRDYMLDDERALAGRQRQPRKQEHAA